MAVVFAAEEDKIVKKKSIAEAQTVLGLRPCGTRLCDAFSFLQERKVEAFIEASPFFNAHQARIEYFNKDGKNNEPIYSGCS